MTPWQRLARAAFASGSAASLASLLALAAGGRRDGASAFGPVNAVSHWIWRDRALREQQASFHYTGPGYLIHHAMSVFWALFYEAAAARPGAPRSAKKAVGTGLAVAAFACVVDLRFTPERLTPGFERRLRPGSLAAVYVAFGLGLAAPRLWEALRR